MRCCFLLFRLPSDEIHRPYPVNESLRDTRTLKDEDDATGFKKVV